VPSPVDEELEATMDDPPRSRSPLLSVRNLAVEFVTANGPHRAVDGISYDLLPGETLGIVGESGSGKTVGALALLGLLPSVTARIAGGEARFNGADLLSLDLKQLRQIRGREIAMVFQDAMTALNPVRTVGSQIGEIIRVHHRNTRRDLLRKRATELLELVGVPDPAARHDQYPHELSGGMRQRAVIAMAIANDPKILIADEPTTALDVTIQAQVVEVLEAAKSATDAAMILISHDLGLIAEMTDRVAVMYAGRFVETGDVHDIFAQAKHPYTVGLMNSLPRLDVEVTRLTPIWGQPPDIANRPQGCAFHPRCPLHQERAPCVEVVPQLLTVARRRHASACHFHPEVMKDQLTFEASGVGRSVAGAGLADEAPSFQQSGDGLRARNMLRVTDLHMHFSGPKSSGPVRAVDGVSFTIRAGETLGLVGESGCGKTTVGRTIIRLLEPTSGSIEFDGVDITHLPRRQLRKIRRGMQIVFQDPFASLNPRKSVHEIIAEPLRIHGLYKNGDGKRVAELLDLVRLPSDAGRRRPNEFSGGQRQRIAIARALALRPRLLILDEPVSAVDVSIQAQIINLLDELQQQLGLAYLFIAHDLAVVRHISDRVAVMYLGRVVETGETGDIFERPTHPYTQALLSAVPVPDPRLRGRSGRIVLEGDLPSPVAPPSGCRFRTRCWKATERCATEIPQLVPPAGHQNPSACHYPELRAVNSTLRVVQGGAVKGTGFGEPS
jgi:peptide/nickel transport system ATP-binding protein